MSLFHQQLQSRARLSSAVLINGADFGTCRPAFCALLVLCLPRAAEGVCAPSGLPAQLHRLGVLSRRGRWCRGRQDSGVGCGWSLPWSLSRGACAGVFVAPLAFIITLAPCEPPRWAACAAAVDGRDGLWRAVGGVSATRFQPLPPGPTCLQPGGLGTPQGCLPGPQPSL